MKPVFLLEAGDFPINIGVLDPYDIQVGIEHTPQEQQGDRVVNISVQLHQMNEQVKITWKPGAQD